MASNTQCAVSDSSADVPARRVDAVGLTCPMPVLLARKALRDLLPGAVVELRASDPLARIDIPHFCAQEGHTLLDESESGGVPAFRIRKGE
jgi:tRNA 2-thiouridine synthesizing protein A